MRHSKRRQVKLPPVMPTKREVTLAYQEYSKLQTPRAKALFIKKQTAEMAVRLGTTYQDILEDTVKFAAHINGDWSIGHCGGQNCKFCFL